jgi:hypothetical protein
MMTEREPLLGYRKHADIIKQGIVPMQKPVNNKYDAVFSMWSMLFSMDLT